MMNFIKEKTQSLERFFRRELLSRLVWLTHERLGFDGEQSDKYAFAVVVGREHYRERRKKYPIASRAELRRVIALETLGRAGVFARIGPLVDNAREVQFFELPDTFLASPPRSLFWIPESVALSLALTETDVATVRRGDFCYFLSSRGTNQLLGGAIVSPKLFRMAAGIPLDGADRQFEGSEDVVAALKSGLVRLRPEDWWDFRGPEFQRAAGELWRPATAFVAGFGFLYLVMVSAYLSGALALRQYQIERLGPEVTPLLQAQRQIDSLAAERAAMKRIVDSRVAAWPMWEIAADVWADGGSLTSMSFNGGDVILNGVAPSAIKVLERLAARKGVVWARFDAGVRQSNEGQQYVIRVRLTGSVAGGR